MNVVKEREYPLALDVISAIHDRLPINDKRREELSEERRIILAGYKGEKSIEYFLQFASDDSWQCLHNVRLPWQNGFYFQMDTVILTPSFISVLEIKNIAGKLFFDQISQQLVRNQDGKEEGFPYPLTQVKRQMQQLEMFLEQHGFSQIPVIPFVVISNSSSIITTNHNQEILFSQVTHASNLVNKLQTTKSQHPKRFLNKKRMDKLSSLLTRSHQSMIPNLMNKFFIKESELLKGPICEQCSKPGMIRKKGYWHCMNCQHKNKHAHVQALIDYYILYGPTISNRQCRDFLQLNSINIVSKLLSGLGLYYSGVSKNRVYKLNYNHLRKLIYDMKKEPDKREKV